MADLWFLDFVLFNMQLSTLTICQVFARLSCVTQTVIETAAMLSQVTLTWVRNAERAHIRQISTCMSQTSFHDTPLLSFGDRDELDLFHLCMHGDRFAFAFDPPIILIYFAPDPPVMHSPAIRIHSNVCRSGERDGKGVTHFTRATLLAKQVLRLTLQMLLCFLVLTLEVRLYLSVNVA